MHFKRSLLLLALVAASAAASAQTVVDGSFENTTIAGWEYAPVGTDWTYGYPSGLANGASPWHDVAEDGNQYGFIQSASGVAGGIIGSITGMNVGQSYDLVFYLGTRAGYGIDPLAVNIGAFNIASNVAPADAMSGTGWTKFSFAFVAQSSNSSLSFIGADPGVYQDLNTAIDNISVQATPEPGSFVALGLGALGLVIRRRSAKRT